MLTGQIEVWKSQHNDMAQPEMCPDLPFLLQEPALIFLDR